MTANLFPHQGQHRGRARACKRLFQPLHHAQVARRCLWASKHCQGVVLLPPGCHSPSAALQPRLVLVVVVAAAAVLLCPTRPPTALHCLEPEQQPARAASGGVHCPILYRWQRCCLT